MASLIGLLSAAILTSCKQELHTRLVTFMMAHEGNNPYGPALGEYEIAEEASGSPSGSESGPDDGLRKRKRPMNVT